MIKSQTSVYSWPQYTLVSSGKSAILWSEARICKEQYNNLTHKKSQVQRMHKNIYIKMMNTCSGVPSKSLPHDKLNKVSPVKTARAPGK